MSNCCYSRLSHSVLKSALPQPSESQSQDANCSESSKEFSTIACQQCCTTTGCSIQCPAPAAQPGKQPRASTSSGCTSTAS